MCEAGTADYTLAGVAHWSDDQLQQTLDDNREEITHFALSNRVEYGSGGSATYKDYFYPFKDLEESTSGTAAFDVEDSTGASAGTADFAINYDASHIRFNSDTEGATYYLTGRSYNIKRAAAQVWERKAAHYVNAYDFAADGARFDRSQMHAHALKMSEHYRGSSGIKISTLIREEN